MLLKLCILNTAVTTIIHLFLNRQHISKRTLYGLQVHSRMTLKHNID